MTTRRYAPEYRRQTRELERTGRTAEHRVATMCRVSGVSSNGYYAWLRRGTSAHARRDGELSVHGPGRRLLIMAG